MPPKRKTRDLNLDIDSKQADVDIDKSGKYLDLDVDEKAIPPEKKQQGGKRGRPKGAKTVNRKKANTWIETVKKVRSENPGMSYKEAMQKASQARKGGAVKDVAKQAVEKVKKATTGARKAVKKGARSYATAVKRAATSDTVKSALKTAEPLARDAAKELAKLGVKEGAKKFKEDIPTEHHATVDKLSNAISSMIDKGVSGKGMIGGYCDACACKCSEQGGGNVGAILASLAPTIIPMGIDLVKGLYKKIAGKGIVGSMSSSAGKGTPGDYSFNELGTRPGQGGSGKIKQSKYAQDPDILKMGLDTVGRAYTGAAKKLFGGVIEAGEPYHQTATDRLHEAEPKQHPKVIPAGESYHQTAKDRLHEALGKGVHQSERSDPPLFNTVAKHDNLWWFIPKPGLMGVTEVPENQFFVNGRDENMGIWTMANDIDEYVNSAPTFEDGVTTIAPTTMTINPTALSGMPQDSTVRSTLGVINRESGEADRGRVDIVGMGMQSNRGFVYAPGMSLSAQARVAGRDGAGIVGSMKSGQGQGGGDITRIGYPDATGAGILPTENVIVGNPVGVSAMGRGAKQKQGGQLIKGSQIATWR